MVERSNTTRRANRVETSSPYRRPSQRASEAKKSWSLGNLLGFLPSFWQKAPSTASESDEEEDRLPVQDSPGHTLVERGINLQATQANVPSPPPSNFLNSPPPPPPPQSSQPMLVASSSASRVPVPTIPESPRSTLSPPTEDRQNNIKKVTAFMSQLGSRQLNEMEILGIVTLLEKSQEEEEEKEKPEPFRFSTSPSVPARDVTPSNGNPGPRKMLTKNPNGQLYWRGGGSAKPRNRYAAPGFPSSRSAPSRLKLTPEKPKADGKRRRLEEQSPPSTSQAGPSSATRATSSTNHLNGSASTPEMSSSAQATSTNSVPFPNDRVNSPPAAQPSSSAPKLNGAATAPPATPRLRTAGIKPTAPAVPSPLRQAWGQTDSPSPPASRPTRAANIISELIRETAPPKKPVFTNPYEDASPVPIKPAPKKPPTAKRRAVAGAQPNGARAVAAAAEQKAEQPVRNPETELSPQKIIEATLPKGAKRARPPPDLEKPKLQPAAEIPLRRSTRIKSPEPPKIFRSQQPAGPSNATHQPMIVEEVDDDDEPSPKKAKPNGVAMPVETKGKGKARSTVEIEDVTDVDMSAAESSVNTVQPSQVIEPEQSPERSISPPATSPTLTNPFSNGGSPLKTGFGVKSSAPRAPSKLRYSIQVDKDDKVQDETSKTPQTLGLGLPSTLANKQPEPSPIPAITVTSASSSLDVVANSKSGPSKSTAEIKADVIAMSVTELPRYQFGIPPSSPGAGPSSLKARADAKALPASSLPKYDFTTSAAPSSSTTSSPPAASAKPVAFNWDAAGIKPPSKPADSWSCDACTLTNAATATAKCQFCDAPRPGASAPAAATTPPAAPAAPTTGFNWAAAGMKQPQSKAGWSCSMCMLNNPDSASKCSVCENPR